MTSINSILRKYNIHPKKSLGQNFLTAVPTLEKIVRTLNPSPNDKVLEIGPGVGVMTKMLTDAAKFVAAIEADKEMISLLESEWGNIPNLHVIHGDVLDTNLEKLLGGRSWIFVGNIPYNITSPLIFHIRRYRHLFRYGLLTIQKEVADRLVAKPGTKDYGILSIAVQAVGEVKKCFNISAESFYPKPKVESSVIRISFEGKPPHDIPDLDFFTSIVRAAFSTRRKKLKNALSQSSLLEIQSGLIKDALDELEIPENTRAEELDISTFVRLAKHFGDK